MAGLHLIQEVFNDPIIKLTQAKDFRWLSHDAAINSIIHTLPSLIASLEREATERSEPAAEGLAKFVKTYIVLLYRLCSPSASHLASYKSHEPDISKGARRCITNTASP